MEYEKEDALKEKNDGKMTTFIHVLFFYFPWRTELQNSLEQNSVFVWNIAQEMQSGPVPSY